jgi:hypothetical protein
MLILKQRQGDVCWLLAFKKGILLFLLILILGRIKRGNNIRGQVKAKNYACLFQL